jgi:hypothetical protein
MPELSPLGPRAGHGWRRLGVTAVKTVHTAAFFSIASSLGYFGNVNSIWPHRASLIWPHPGRDLWLRRHWA